MRTHTRQELIAETLGTLITLLVLWGGLYAVLWALAETAEAQEVSCGVEGKPACDAAESYEELGPKLDQDEILNTPQGPCKRRNWQLYTGTCSKVEDTVTVPEADVFHPNGQTWAEHFEASKQCHAINAWLLESYNWFLGTLGPEHGLTQMFKYSLAASIDGCAK